MAVAKKVRRLIDYDSIAQYKMLKTIAKNKGFVFEKSGKGCVKLFIQSILRNEVEKFEKKQLELFEKSKTN